MFILQEWDINKYRQDNNMWESLLPITTSQVVKNEKKHGLSMLNDKNLLSVIATFFLIGTERYI